MAGRLAARMDLIERAKAVEVALEGSQEEDDEMVSAVAAGFPDAAAAAAALTDDTVDLMTGADL